MIQKTPQSVQKVFRIQKNAPAKPGRCKNRVFSLRIEGAGNRSAKGRTRRKRAGFGKAVIFTQSR